MEVRAAAPRTGAFRHRFHHHAQPNIRAQTRPQNVRLTRYS
jgi:hypothetical protein